MNSKTPTTPGQTSSVDRKTTRNQNNPDLVLQNGSSVGYLSLPFNMLLKTEKDLKFAQKLYG